MNGNSMLSDDARRSIADGSIVLVNEHLQPLAGQLVVVWLHDQDLGVNKAWNPKGDGLWLVSYNGEHAPIHVDEASPAPCTALSLGIGRERQASSHARNGGNMKKLGICIVVVVSAVAFAQQPGRSTVGGVIFPGPPYASSDSVTVNTVRVLNTTLAKANSECGLYESVYWSGRVLTSPQAIKQDVIVQMTNRRRVYTVFDRSAEVEMFHIVSPNERELIVGGWIQVDSVLTLAWCNARPS